MDYWAEVARRAWSEAAKAVKLDSRKLLIFLVLGQILIGAMIYFALGPENLSENLLVRCATIASPILLFIPFFVWEFISTPPKMHAEQDAALRRAEQEAASMREAENAGVSANTNHQAICIEFEPVEPWVRRTVFPAGNARFELYVRVRNTGNGFLSEVMVGVVKINPTPIGHTSGILSEQFVLARGEYRYVQVAGFNETRNGDQTIYNDVVTLSFADGGLFARYAELEPPSETVPALITLEAKALECRAETKRFKIWVAENRRLMMTQA